MNNHKIAAVILIFDNYKHLPEIIGAVKSQGTAVKQIVAVDNSSNKQDITNLAIDHIINLPENRGVGYGHNAGWRYIIDQGGFDFIWCIEHDCIPANDCLDKLISGFEMQEDKSLIGCIAPVEMPDLDFEKFDYYKTTSKGLIKETDKSKLENYYGGMSFNGTLLPIRTIQIVGYLREDFFVGFEDIDFFERIYRAKMKCLRITSAVVKHDLYKNRKKIFFGNKVLMLANTSIFRDYYSTRNSTYRLIKKRRYLILFTRVLLLPILMIGKPSYFKRFRTKVTAMIDGMNGDLGKKSYSFLQ